MQKVIYIVIAVALVITIALFVLGFMSKKGHALGLKDNHLQACVSVENCVISEPVDGHTAMLEAFTFSEDKADFLVKLTNVIESMGGNIITSDESYIASTFTSGIFGFVDDVEFRLSDTNQLHFRSASRVGRKDFGANKKRIETLKLLLKK